MVHEILGKVRQTKTAHSRVGNLRDTVETQLPFNADVDPAPALSNSHAYNPPCVGSRMIGTGTGTTTTPVWVWVSVRV